MTKAFVTAVVTGAGLGTRMGHLHNKMLIDIDGSQVLLRALRALHQSGAFDAYVVVVKEDIRQIVASEILPKVFGENFSNVQVCLGGETRQDSVKAGLDHLPPETEIVAVHDGARPFLAKPVIDRLLARVEKGDVDGAICVIPMKDTIKYVGEDGLVKMTPNRARLFAAQTPQVFWKKPLLNAYQKAIWEEIPITDDAQMVEIFGGTIATVPGDEANIKITTPVDLLFGERILSERELD